MWARAGKVGEEWGEQLVGRVEPAVFVLDIADGRVTRVAGLAEHGVAASGPVWAPMAHFNVMVKGIAQLFPGGPPVVKAALGQAGSSCHCESTHSTHHCVAVRRASQPGSDEDNSHRCRPAS